METFHVLRDTICAYQSEWHVVLGTIHMDHHGHDISQGVQYITACPTGYLALCKLIDSLVYRDADVDNRLVDTEGEREGRMN